MFVNRDEWKCEIILKELSTNCITLLSVSAGIFIWLLISFISNRQFAQLLTSSSVMFSFVEMLSKIGMVIQFAIMYDAI